MENKNYYAMIIGIVCICIFFFIIIEITDYTIIQSISSIIIFSIGFVTLYYYYVKGKATNDRDTKAFFEITISLLVVTVLVLFGGIIFEYEFNTILSLIGFAIGILSAIIGYNALKQSKYSLSISQNSIELAQRTETDIDSIMNALFLNILSTIEQRNLVIRDLVARNNNNLTGALWMTREDMDSLGELIEEHEIEPRNLNKLVGRFNGLLRRLSEDEILNAFQFEGIHHVLWMEKFILENVTINSTTEENIEETQERIRNILNLNEIIPIDIEIIDVLQDNITEDIRWENYVENRNIFDNIFVIEE